MLSPLHQNLLGHTRQLHQTGWPAANPMYQCNDYTLDPHGPLTHQQIVTQFANPQLQKPLSLSYYHPRAGAAPGAAAKAPHTIKPANNTKIAIISNSYQYQLITDI
jgi:hypothetical protein